MNTLRPIWVRTKDGAHVNLAHAHQLYVHTWYLNDKRKAGQIVAEFGDDGDTVTLAAFDSADAAYATLDQLVDTMANYTGGKGANQACNAVLWADADSDLAPVPAAGPPAVPEVDLNELANPQ